MKTVLRYFIISDKAVIERNIDLEKLAPVRAD
jgi:hypothetical protein